MSVLLGIGTFFLVIVSILMVLAILMQRTKSDGGVGAALGGGMAEAAFGGESGNVLTKATTYMAVTFFVLSLGLYLGYLYNHHRLKEAEQNALPTSPDLVAPAGAGAAADPFALPLPEVSAPAVPPDAAPVAPDAAPAAPAANP